MATNQASREKTQPGQSRAGAKEAPGKCFDSVSVSVLLLTIVAFLPTLQNGFVEWDERLLVRNANYRGWGWSQIAWAFTDVQTASYQPLSWITFNLDYLFWGMDPFGFHLTNLIVHALATLVLYFVCLRLLSLRQPNAPDFVAQSRRLVAGFSALIFGIHPLRVEPVALTAARSDLLCGFFVLVSILIYLRVSRDGGSDRHRMGWRMLWVLSFSLSLLASAKGLVLPFVLLLLDIYPLKRLGSAPGSGLDRKGIQVLRQKIIFVAFGLIVVLLPRLALYQTGDLPSKDYAGFASGLFYVFVAPAFYAWKSLLPWGYSLHYEFSVWFMALSVLGLAAISGILLCFRVQVPAVLAGWVGYLVLILPGVAMGRLGLPLVSDRNSYLPGIPLAILAGLALLACIGLLARSRLALGARTVAVIPAVFIVVILILVSWNQTQAWSDTETVLRRSAAAGSSAEAHFQLAVFLQAREKDDDAVTHYRRAAAIAPGRWDAHEKAGVLLHKQGRIPEAVSHLRIAVANDPNAVVARENLASGLVTIGAVGEAIQHFRRVLELSPDLNEARLKLATILAVEGQLGEATSLFEQAIKQEPGDAKIHSKLGEVLAAQGKLDGAIQAFRRALQIQPMDAEFHENLGRALTERGLKEEGAKHLREAIRILQSTPAAG